MADFETHNIAYDQPPARRRSPIIALLLAAGLALGAVGALFVTGAASATAPEVQSHTPLAPNTPSKQA